jgi:hypothetical protein
VGFLSFAEADSIRLVLSRRLATVLVLSVEFDTFSGVKLKAFDFAVVVVQATLLMTGPTEAGMTADLGDTCLALLLTLLWLQL